MGSLRLPSRTAQTTARTKIGTTHRISVTRTLFLRAVELDLEELVCSMKYSYNQHPRQPIQLAKADDVEEVEKDNADREEKSGD